MLDTRSPAGCKWACKKRVSSYEHRESRIKNRASGFTFTEVIVVSALLVVAFVPILKALTGAQVTNSIIKHRTVSLILAQGKLDEIKARMVYNWGASWDWPESDISLDGPYLCNVELDIIYLFLLRKMTVSVGYDLDGDAVLDAGEIEVALATLMARR